MQYFYPSNDFFGLLKDVAYVQKKVEVIENYKLLFRFSLDRLQEFISQETFMVLLLQYISDTQMQRIHSRSVLLKHKPAYYMAFENIINFSSKHMIAKSVLDNDWTNLAYQNGQKPLDYKRGDISLDNLKELNDAKNIQVN